MSAALSAHMPVLLVANNFPPVRGGSAAVYDSLARHSGRDVTVLAPRINYADGLPIIGWREHDRRAPYAIIRLPLLRTIINSPLRPSNRLFLALHDLLIRLRIVWALGRLIHANRPRAICIGELLASSWMVRLLRFLPGVRVVVYVHGEEITTVERYDKLSRRRIQALRAADAIIVVSRFTQRIVCDLIGPAAAARVTLLENGVDTSRFTPAPKCAQLQALHGLAGHFVFVSVCRLLEKKGIDNALRAFARLEPGHADCRYLIVGTGPYEPELRRLALELGVADRVVFAGAVAESDLVEHYRLGDVFVMPNRQLANGDTEGFGLVFLEANACGLPVIAGCDGGSLDAVTHDANGLVVDGKSVEEIADAMRRLREDDALRQRIARTGIETAARADWKQKARAFLRVCAGQTA
jgi:phosphatidylinositol alpha-1,6-mannosyltransferase